MCAIDKINLFAWSPGVLFQVSLGRTNDLVEGDYNADKLPKGKHSTKGLGRVEPQPWTEPYTVIMCVTAWICS